MSDTPRSALALLVTRVAANHEKFPVPSHQLTVFTDSFNARTHLHANTPETIMLQAIFVETSFLQNRAQSGKGEIAKRGVTLDSGNIP
jgi:hypothetical protein